MIHKFNTPVGEMIAGADSRGLFLLGFSDKSVSDYAQHADTDNDDRAASILSELRRQLNEYFEGKRKEFSVPLSIGGSSFSRKVWDELLKIPCGTTKTYLEQATSLKIPKAIRAVARANGMNRIAILIPCHRIIGTGGRLTGYAGGVERKRWLLDHEKKYYAPNNKTELF